MHLLVLQAIVANQINIDACHSSYQCAMRARSHGNCVLAIQPRLQLQTSIQTFLFRGDNIW